MNKHDQFITPGMKVSEMILEKPHYIIMMEHFGLQLAVQEKTVEQLCQEHHINTDLFLAFANLFNGYDPNPFPSVKDIPVILEYLKLSHTYYLEEKLPKIGDYINRMKVLNDHSEMVLAGRFFLEYRKEIEEHLQYENDVVFPYILSLCPHYQGIEGQDLTSEYSVKVYRDHHNDIEEKLSDLRNLLIKYLPVEADQQVRRKLLYSLSELEYDLSIHSRIEDTILVPLVEVLERNFNRS